MNVRKLLLLLALVPGLAWAQSRPTWGSGTTISTATTGTCTPSTSTLGSVAATDVVLLVVQTEGYTIALTTANNFVQVTNSPQATGTGGSGLTRLAVYWVRGSSWTSAPVVTGTTDHIICSLHRFVGVYDTGDPWAVTAGGNNTSSTSYSITSATTGSAGNFLIVLIASNSYNGTSTAQCSSWTNANLANLTERLDATNTVGLGGGHCIATGDYSSNGDWGTTTMTLANASDRAWLSIALKPGTDPVGSGGMMGFWP